MRAAFATLHSYANVVLLRAWCASPLHWLQRCATFSPGVERHHGLGRPITEGAAAAPILDSGFFHVHMLRVAHGFLFGGPCWDTRKGVPVPSAGRPTQHGLPPLLGRKGGRFQTCSEGANMANTAPKPTTGNHHSIDLVALHGEAINACAMATYYTRKGNHAGAARKSVQALTALRRLAAVRTASSAHVCTTCRDNFPLPQADDVFDAMVIAGYVERRTACDLCPTSSKPCLTNGRA